MQQLKQYDQSGISPSVMAGMSRDPQIMHSRLHYIFSPAEEIDVADRKLYSIDSESNMDGFKKIPRARILTVANISNTHRNDELDDEGSDYKTTPRYAAGIAEELNRAYSYRGVAVLWTLTGVPEHIVRELEADAMRGYTGDTVVELLAHLERVQPREDLAIMHAAYMEMKQACIEAEAFCARETERHVTEMRERANGGKGPNRTSPAMRELFRQINKNPPDDLEQIIQRMKTQPTQVVVQQQGQADGVERKPCDICGEMIAAQAKKCRFCGEWLQAKSEPSLAAKEEPKPVVSDDPRELPVADLPPREERPVPAVTLAEKAEAVFDREMPMGEEPKSRKKK